MGEIMEMKLLPNEEEQQFMDDNSIVVAEVKGRNDKSHKRWPYLGILLATVSSLFFSLCSVIVKSMENVNPMELAIFRFVGVLVPVMPIVIWNYQDPFPKENRFILLLRAFLGATGLMLSFYAFRHMPLADASVIIFSAPVFVAVFARIFLKEPCGLFNIVTIILTLLGVILISRPTYIFGDTSSTSGHKSSYEKEYYGALAACASTAFSANVYVLLRALKAIHFSVVMVNFGTFALLQTVAFTWYTGKFCWPECGFERYSIIALALFSFIGQILLTISLKLENAGPVAIARTSDIVFAFIWQIIFFNEVPNVYSVIGAVLVVSSVILSAVRKWLHSLSSEVPLKRRLSFFM